MKATSFPELKSKELLKITLHALDRIRERWYTLYCKKTVREIRAYLTNRIPTGINGEFGLVEGITVVVRENTIITIY